MRQVWHPYWKWEDHAAGMFRPLYTPAEGDEALSMMSDVPLWGEAMAEVPRAWPISSEHNLSNLAQNRLAWLGQAAVCLWLGVPAAAVASSWWRLPQAARIAANAAATDVIIQWEEARGCHANRPDTLF